MSAGDYIKYLKKKSVHYLWQQIILNKSIRSSYMFWMKIMLIFQILGICFAQNLRADIFAQKAKWHWQSATPAAVWPLRVPISLLSPYCLLYQHPHGHPHTWHANIYLTESHSHDYYFTGEIYQLYWFPKTFSVLPLVAIRFVYLH